MLYIQRDAQGQICQVSLQADFAGQECLPDDHPELVSWRRRTLQQLQDSDLELVRVLEDLVEVLSRKGVIRYTDLPSAAREKLAARVQNRHQVNVLSNLLGDDEGLI